MSNTDIDRMRRRLKPFNKVIVALQRAGLALGTMRVLSVPGRKSGELRTTPVSPLTVDGITYVVGGFEQADWVKNARAAGWGELSRGRRRHRVILTELPVEERAPILRAFPREVPHGVQFFVKTGVITSPDPDSFAAAAPRCPVFRIDPAPEG
ncbi:nitroreductase/quinone reductase family protein [Nocardia wallacei]|uniref:nitroreductase/quinone reductase family protein n=1 Tax=Nocardia wallacei TaxID=480035 RepID=UPI002454D391|nr:nitroreductase/quinone reductase family protein [Nocardia wallacei]